MPTNYFDMKNNFLLTLTIIITTTFLLSSCSKFKLFSEDATPYHYGILKDINNTMTHNPEQALLMIESFGTNQEYSSLKTSELHEFQILKAEARYKCNLNHDNIIALNEAIMFFDSLTSIYEKNTDILFYNSKAHYYMGVGDEEKENYKTAFVNYLESLSLIERIRNINARSKEINHFKALIYVRLGDILYWLDSYDAAIECLKNANILFENEDNHSAITRNNIIIAIMHGQNYDYDRAFRHLSIADSLLLEHNPNSPLKYDIERINASIMHELGYSDEPLKAMLKQYKTLESPNQKMEAAGVLGDIYYEKGILDSAIYYYEQYYPDNNFSKINAANHIIEISLKTGNNELITKYAPSLAEETNKELLLSTIKTEISSLYEQYDINKKNQDVYNKILTYLAMLLAITLMYFFLGMHLLKIKKRKFGKEISEKKFYIEALQEKIDKKSSENKSIKIRIKNLENELQDIKTKRYLTHVPFDMKLIKLIEEPMCKRLSQINDNTNIKSNVQYPELILSEKEQNDLVNLFNKTYDNAFSKLVAEHKGLRNSDILLFCLYLIGLDEKHISAVTGKTYNMIYNRTKKIQSIFGSSGSIKEILRDIL